jgi:hypothetical protein
METLLSNGTIAFKWNHCFSNGTIDFQMEPLISNEPLHSHGTIDFQMEPLLSNGTIDFYIRSLLWQSGHLYSGLLRLAY